MLERASFQGNNADSKKLFRILIASNEISRYYAYVQKKEGTIHESSTGSSPRNA